MEHFRYSSLVILAPIFKYMNQTSYKKFWIDKRASFYWQSTTTLALAFWVRQELTWSTLDTPLL
jgi:hypothetical protein